MQPGVVHYGDPLTYQEKPMGHAQGNVNSEVQKDVGAHVREWRQRRRMSQLDLACEADISTRHLSFVETGRAQPSRDMLMLLADHLSIPLRERNVLMVSAGFAPVFPERPLDHPDMAAARSAMQQVLDGHEPWPALAIDRHWNLIAANAALPSLLAGISSALLAAPVNVLHLSLHPDGLAPRIVNYAQWREHLLGRLRQQIDITADTHLMGLLAALKAYPAPNGATGHVTRGQPAIVAPLQLAIDGVVLSFISTTTIFGTPLDITLSELALETFFPVDDVTRNALQAMATDRR